MTPEDLAKLQADLLLSQRRQGELVHENMRLSDEIARMSVALTTLTAAPPSIEDFKRQALKEALAAVKDAVDRDVAARLEQLTAAQAGQKHAEETTGRLVDLVRSRAHWTQCAEDDGTCVCGLESLIEEAIDQ